MRRTIFRKQKCEKIHSSESDTDKPKHLISCWCENISASSSVKPRNRKINHLWGIAHILSSHFIPGISNRRLHQSRSVFIISDSNMWKENQTSVREFSQNKPKRKEENAELFWFLLVLLVLLWAAPSRRLSFVLENKTSCHFCKAATINLVMD